MSDVDEDYGFEYSDEELDEEQVDVENQYYNAKGTLFENIIRFFSVLFLSLSLSFRRKRRSNELISLSLLSFLILQACWKTRRTLRKRSRRSRRW